MISYMYVTIPLKYISNMFFYTPFKIFNEVDLLTGSGKVFHSRGAEEENEPSYIAFFDLGTAREPLVVDLSVR